MLKVWFTMLTNSINRFDTREQKGSYSNHSRLDKKGLTPPDSHLVLGCSGLYGDSLGPTARPCMVYYLMCVLS
jgi:hypothetical protein